jgi:hypothetical protein
MATKQRFLFVVLLLKEIEADVSFFSQAEEWIEAWIEQLKVGTEKEKDSVIPANVFLAVAEFLSERLRNFNKLSCFPRLLISLKT